MTEPPTLVHGQPGEQCPSCAAPLAPDQRYCLNCGSRRAERRVPVEAGAAPPPPLAVSERGLTPSPHVPAAQRLGGAWGVAALLLIALGVGVIIGNLSAADDAPAQAAQAPVIIGSGVTGAANATVANTGAAADEWPDQDGWTVQLGELPGTATQAEADAAKVQATSRGAEAPGVLEAGAHGLTEGQLVLYSGVFDTKKEATAALDGVKAAYPDARVIEVKATSDAGDAGGAAADDAAAADEAGGSGDRVPATVSKSELKAKENLSPEAFQKQSKKLPKTTALPGKAPPKDNAAPGGGSEAETIG